MAGNPGFSDEESTGDDWEKPAWRVSTVFTPAVPVSEDDLSGIIDGRVNGMN